jgi:hypothetical protein
MKMVVTNTSKFRCDNELFKKYVIDTIDNILASNANSIDKKPVIYLSGPMTGVDNYNERFKELLSLVYTKLGKNKDIIIINPSELIDNIPEEYNATYIDKVYYTYLLVQSSDILVIDDRDDLWLQSRGVLLELMTAIHNVGDISIYNYDYLTTLEEGE